MRGAAGRWAFDFLERGLEPLAARHPRSALAAAAALGRLRNRLSRRWPTPEQVSALFPHLEIFRTNLKLFRETCKVIDARLLVPHPPDA